MIPPLSRCGKIAFYPVFTACAGVVCFFSFTYYAAGPSEAAPDVVTHSSGFGRAREGPRAADGIRLRIMTLNLAHGRGDGFHQLLEGREEIVSHLEAVAAVLRREAVDAAALQEADGPCFWSGNFDHVGFLAEAARFAFSLRGEHVKAPGLSYGTALLSRFPLENPRAVTFPRQPPAPPKGFVAATLFFPSRPGPKVDLVSVHLDFLLPAVRERQAEAIIRALAPRRRPMILMGDFNSSWEEAGSPLRRIAEALELRLPPREAGGDGGRATFPSTGRRIDWILVSPELEVTEFRVLPDALSDHRAVLAEVRCPAGR